MTRTELVAAIRASRSYLCVGLDTDPSKIPAFLKTYADPVFEFNRRLIDATKSYCVAYKINTAFYETRGVKGWETLERTAAYLPQTHLRIADAKRGDIGNTAEQYARAFFDTLSFDAVTVAPYMGKDSVAPFLEHKNKWTILLALTSNPGAADFELQPAGDGLLYEQVLRKASGWGDPTNLMFVVGATRAESLAGIRRLTPDHFYLVPGVGAQGGSLAEISRLGLISDGGLLVNASRAIANAGQGEDFAERAADAARIYAAEMSGYLEKAGVLK